MPDDRNVDNSGGQRAPPREGDDNQTVLYDFTANGDDEISLRRGQLVKVLSRDPNVSGDEGWWTGECGGKLGIFPSNYVTSTPEIDSISSSSQDVFTGNNENRPPEIDIREIDKKDFVGNGGFGKVYEGTYRNQRIAIKALEPTDPSIASNDDAILAEGGFFWQLNHENIVHLLGVCIHPPDYWLIMEFCMGGALNKVLGKHLIVPGTLLSWASQIAKGMEYIHSKNIIHRDLKSWNVLLLEPYDPETGYAVTLKITDFGLARHSVHSTVVYGGGTYRWMAPENITESKYSWRSDVWSFGVVLWELLTGETPYKSMDGAAIAFGIGSRRLKLHIPDTCPEHLKKLLNACWSSDPYDRPPFSDITKTIEAIAKSAFKCTPRESFYTMQNDWKVEIDKKFEELKVKELELGEREKMIVEKEKQLLDQSRSLQRRENEVILKELAQTFFKPPPPPKKRNGKFRNKSINISSPTDFKHKVTWSSSGNFAPNGAPPPIPLVQNTNNSDCFRTSHPHSFMKQRNSPRSMQRTTHPATTGYQSDLRRSPQPNTQGLMNLRSQSSPMFTRRPIAVIPLSETNSAVVTPNGRQKYRARSSSAANLSDFSVALTSADHFIQNNESFEREHDSSKLIVNPMTQEEQLISLEDSVTPSKETRKKASLMGHLKQMCESILQKLPGGNSKEHRSITLKNHSRSYDELGYGEHLQEAPRSLDDSRVVVGTGGRYQHNTYHGELTQRASGLRPPLFPSTPLWDNQTLLASPHTPRRRSSTTSHDSDQAYNSGASSILGPSPIGNAAIVSTPQQTSDYPYTPSSAELASNDTLCNSHSTHSPYELPPRGSVPTLGYHQVAMSSPSSSHGSSVYDNPGAKPKSPPRTPQLYARNLSTPNANAYKIHGSPFTPRRKPPVAEALPRPSTLNIQRRLHQTPSNQISPLSERTPDRSPPEVILSRFPSEAGSRQAVHLPNFSYQSGWNDRTQTPSPAPASPITPLYGKDPTIDSLERDFKVQF